MADDRTGAHAAVGPDEDIHDDDELAAALAAELERIAPTGAVPVLRASAVPFGPVRPTEPAPAPGVAVSLPEAQRPERPTPPRATEPAAAVLEPDSALRPEALAPRAARRQPPPAPPATPVPDRAAQHHRHADTPARHAETASRAARLHAVPVGAPSGGPGGAAAEAAPVPSPALRAPRIPTFSTTAEPRPDVTPGRRRAAEADPSNTQPVRIPGDVRATSASAPPEPMDLQDPLRETGPLALPPTLYESWERSLRSIGRPHDADWGETPVADHSDPEAATVSLSRASLGPLPDSPLREAPAEAPAGAASPARPAPDTAAQPEPRRRRRARRSAQIEPVPEGSHPTAAPTPAPAPVAPAPAVAAVPALSRGAAPEFAEAPLLEAPPLAEEEREGVDEVDTGIRAVSAADTAAVPLPPMIEQTTPVTGAVPVPQPGHTGDAAAAPRGPLGGPSLLALLLLWCGALASPAMLLAGFGLAAGGAGGAAAGALVLGVAVAVPGALRLTAAADADRIGSPGIAARLLGPRGGPALAGVLLAARLLAATIALLGVADLAGAFTARTGVGGPSSSSASLAAVLLAGLAALVAVAWPRRTTRKVLAALAALALAVVLVVLLLTSPAVATSVPAVPPAASTVQAGAIGFGVVGLLLAATGADAAVLAVGRRRRRGAVAVVLLSAIVGVVVLVLALAVGRGAGASGDAATALSGVVADATPAAAAGPVAIALLVAALPLPALLLATCGHAAAALIGAGRSARLGSVAAGLLVLAAALALFAAGVSAPAALVTLGPVVGVPVAVWAGMATVSPLHAAAARSVRTTLLVVAAVGTLIGWALVDGLVATGERSPLLDLLRIPLDSIWRGGPALGLLVAFLLGLVAALLGRVAAARAAAPPASRFRSGGVQPVDSVEG